MKRELRRNHDDPSEDAYAQGYDAAGNPGFTERSNPYNPKAPSRRGRQSYQDWRDGFRSRTAVEPPVFAKAAR